jgi:hypothetical protein
MMIGRDEIISAYKKEKDIMVGLYLASGQRVGSLIRFIESSDIDDYGIVRIKRYIKILYGNGKKSGPISESVYTKMNIKINGILHGAKKFDVDSGQFYIEIWKTKYETGIVLPTDCE